MLEFIFSLDALALLCAPDPNSFSLLFSFLTLQLQFSLFKFDVPFSFPNPWRGTVVDEHEHKLWSQTIWAIRGATTSQPTGRDNLINLLISLLIKKGG